jgi:hypothetical protein
MNQRLRDKVELMIGFWEENLVVVDAEIELQNSIKSALQSAISAFKRKLAEPVSED